jgi:lipid A 3-O-deacylase
MTQATKWLQIITVVFLLIPADYTKAGGFIDEISFGVGEEKNDDIDIYRLGLKKDFSRQFLTNKTGWLSGYFEGSLNYWHHTDDDIYALALSPVFVYYFGTEANSVIPYIEGGIGVAVISDTEIGGVDMTTAFQFEDRIGAGIRIEKLDFNFRYMHYSNGSMSQPNDGIDIWIGTLSYRF